MSYIKKTILFLAILFASLIFTSNISNADTTRSASTGEELINAIGEAQTGDTVELSADISLKQPIEITGKNIIISGKGHSITKDEEWANNGSNGTFISVGAEAKVTLSNITLKNSAKYGVQSYNGGYVILNKVTITNCSYGGVLVNAGTVEIRDLTLGKNGTPNNNGIEIAKGSGTDEANVPTIVMNGTLTSSEKDNVVYVAENNPSLKKFEVENADGTDNQILINGNTVVIADEDGRVLYTSNEIKGVEVDGEDYTGPRKEEPKEEPKDDTPKTGIEVNLIFAVLLTITSMVGISFFKKTNN